MCADGEFVTAQFIIIIAEIKRADGTAHESKHYITLMMTGHPHYPHKHMRVIDTPSGTDCVHVKTRTQWKSLCLYSCQLFYLPFENNMLTDTGSSCADSSHLLGNQGD